MHNPRLIEFARMREKGASDFIACRARMSCMHVAGVSCLCRYQTLVGLLVSVSATTAQDEICGVELP